MSGSDLPQEFVAAARVRQMDSTLIVIVAGVLWLLLVIFGLLLLM